jgi:ribosomal protein L11 methyltransferase
VSILADPSPPSTVVARLVADETAARAITDGLAESFDALEAVASAQIDGPGRWTVAIHFRDPPNEAAIRALVALAAGTEAANALAFGTIAGKDWVTASLAGLAPVKAGRFFVHGAHDRARVPLNRIGIEIEAALAFGTGHHGSTRGCLIALDAIAKAMRPRRILDLGTGSGVLAIAAARALRRRVLASDIDHVAVRAARENARLNRVGGAIALVRADGLDRHSFRICGPFDLVFANILLEPLLRFAAPLAKLTAPTARVVLSGLLASQGNALLAAYRPHGLFLERRIRLDGWLTLVLRRGACRTHTALSSRPSA